jgi:hypothetical protein
MDQTQAGDPGEASIGAVLGRTAAMGVHQEIRIDGDHARPRSHSCIRSRSATSSPWGSAPAPRIHDVSDILLAERERLPEPVRPEVERLATISRDLRRDRELASYGAEDLTPSSFYSQGDATRAREGAALTVRLVRSAVAA